MSQMSVATTLAKRSTSGAPRTSLRVVTPEQSAGSAWFPAVCVALLLAGLAAVLGLNTAMAQDSFAVSKLEAQSAQLADTEDSLKVSINERSTPQNLADEAHALGMVPAGSAAFLDLEAGEVLGVASAAKKSESPTVDAAASASPDEPRATKPAAKETSPKSSNQ